MGPMESFDRCHACGTLTNIRQLQGEILYPENYPKLAPFWVKLCEKCHAGLMSRGSISVSGESLNREKPTWWI